jgi:hypothetical protein
MIMCKEWKTLVRISELSTRRKERYGMTKKEMEKLEKMTAETLL